LGFGVWGLGNIPGAPGALDFDAVFDVQEVSERAFVSHLGNVSTAPKHMDAQREKTETKAKVEGKIKNKGCAEEGKTRETSNAQDEEDAPEVRTEENVPVEGRQSREKVSENKEEEEFSATSEEPDESSEDTTSLTDISMLQNLEFITSHFQMQTDPKEIGLQPQTQLTDILSQKVDAPRSSAAIQSAVLPGTGETDSENRVSDSDSEENLASLPVENFSETESAIKTQSLESSMAGANTLQEVSSVTREASPQNPVFSNVILKSDQKNSLQNLPEIRTSGSEKVPETDNENFSEIENLPQPDLAQFSTPFFKNANLVTRETTPEFTSLDSKPLSGSLSGVSQNLSGISSRTLSKNAPLLSEKVGTVSFQGMEEWSSLQKQVRDALHPVVSNTDKKIEIQMDPPEWGRLNVELRWEKNEAHVSFMADRPFVKDMIERHVTELRQWLNQNGVQTLNVHVGLNQKFDSPRSGYEKGEGKEGGLYETKKINKSSGDVSKTVLRFRDSRSSMVDQTV